MVPVLLGAGGERRAIERNTNRGSCDEDAAYASVPCDFAMGISRAIFCSYIPLLAALNMLDGCSNDPAGPDGGSNEADGGSEPDSGSCLVEEEIDPTPDPACTGRWTTVLGASIVDEEGAPLENGKGQACLREAGTGVLTCLQPMTSCAGGNFEQVVPEGVRCIGSMVVRVFDPDAPEFGSDIPGSFANTFCPVDLPATPPELRLSEPVVLYRTTPVMDLPPEGDGMVARTVRFEGGLEVDITPATIFGDWGYTRLASRMIDMSGPTPCFIRSTDPSFGGVWGFTPNINVFGDKGYPLRVKGTGLQEGTVVDLYVLGSIDCALTSDFATVVEEGHWQQYETSTVDENGDFSGTLPCFNWFAYAPR